MLYSHNYPSGGTAGMVVGASITGTNIPAGTTIKSIDSSNQITMSQGVSGNNETASNIIVGQFGAFGDSQSGGAILVGNNASSVTGSAALLIGGAYTVASSVTVQTLGSGATQTATVGGANTSGTATYTGNTTLNRATILQAAAGGTVLFNTGTWTTNNSAVTVGSTRQHRHGQLVQHTYKHRRHVAVNYGTLLLGVANALGGSATPLTMGGGVLDLGAASQTVGAVSITVAPSSGNTIQNGNLTGNSYAASNTSGNAVITANLLANGSIGLTKSGAGTLTLAGANTYTGTTAINAGTLQFAKPSSLYNSTTGSWTAANIKVASGGTFAVNVGGPSDFTTGNVTTLLTNLDGTVSNNGLQAGSSIGFDTTNATSAVTLTNVIANTTGTGGGAVGVVKLGSGTLILDASNTYTGGTTVNGGTLQISGTGTLTAANGAMTVNAGGNLSLTNRDVFPAVAGTRSAVNTLTISGGSNAWTGLVNLGNTGMVITNATTATNAAGLPDDPTIRNQLIQGIGSTSGTNNAPNWTGTGGFTSAAAAASGGSLSVGYFVSGNTVTVAAVLGGDADLNGLVDNRDRNTLLAGLANNAMNAAKGARWQDADFNYDGVVDTKDRSHLPWPTRACP